MAYAVKELFKTLQGEGAQAGRAAVFCRFAGCNLWSGREEDRAEAACRFCDTDFVGIDGEGGGRFATAADLAEAIAATWSNAGATGGGDREGGQGAAPSSAPGVPPSAGAFVVFTGGEPLLQLDDALVAAVHARGFAIAVETNGTLKAPAGIDWICVSPKAGTDLAQSSGQELKLVFPQDGVDPAQLEGLDFSHFFLQPMDGPHRLAHTQAAVAYCLTHPRWRLSLQTHKMIGIP